MNILDACCGSKMFWYDKEEPHTTYMDIRNEVLAYTDRDTVREVVINPDIVSDFRNIPFADNSFDLVVFDPPHLIHVGDTSWLAKKYGKLDKKTWPQDLKLGFDECMRVLKLNGTMLFKWNEDQIKIKDVFAVFEQQPILGDKRSKTRWSVFIKKRAK
ncbi:methyltransferase domain-containing protein [Ligilactobacillus salivarius]|uniref:methyltransferase domain-containing protein n=1 Tax=Ligilactobacillus salivarius TaxID=1624 RepID=UPI00136A413B|nr:methyltransferase domain-containing protein [Ligilactobacillus salivarius]MYZ03900.1 class I SAM-dependent methyltransferase [Ligilactobacillus salivarius]MYZ71804.1 class I SAM-dependent methyltransferase [Ligilactobacillus salivarius]MYZ77335.1 class I SAM-dependent methyltransferase [Ligilactobacillus salivarius]